MRLLKEFIRYHRYPVDQVDAMSARSARSYPRHAHDQYGIGVVDDGVHSSWSGRGQVEAQPGSLICCNPGEVTDGRAVHGRPRSWRMLYIEPGVWRALCSEVLERDAGEFTFCDPVFASEGARLLFERVFRHVRAPGPGSTIEVETALINLAAGLQNHSSERASKSDRAHGTIRRAKNRIDADPSAPVSLSDLAEETGLNRYQVIRAFSKDLGMTPHAYIMQKRTEQARHLIRMRYSLAEVAVVTGFYDQSHLTRCFARQFGITPSRYAAATP